MRFRLLVRDGLLAATALIVAPTMAVGTASAGEPVAPTFQHYVALGDSYTSGPLITPPTPDQPACLRSTANYPSLLAAKLHVASFTDASCVGATTANMTQPELLTDDLGNPIGQAAPQFTALTPNTDLVTLGIGGNDSAVFGSLIGVCATLRAADPAGSPCRQHFTVNGVDTLKAALSTTLQSVIAVIKGIQQRAPHATIVVVDYPRLLPANGTCPTIMPFATADYRWMDSVERDLNRQLAWASARTSATFVDTYRPSRGHDACAGNAAWINGQNTDPAAALAYHPFAPYMQAATSLIGEALTDRPGLAPRLSARPGV